MQKLVERKSEKDSLTDLTKFEDSDSSESISSVTQNQEARVFGLLSYNPNNFLEVGSEDNIQESRSSHEPSLLSKQVLPHIKDLLEEYELTVEKEKIDKEFPINIKRKSFSAPNEKTLASEESFDITISKDEDFFFADNQILNIYSSYIGPDLRYSWL